MDAAVVITDTTSDIHHALSARAILSATWEDLEGVLTGRRDPQVMIHLTRIVGYYSRVQNWNRSKLAELDDRHKGNYAFPAASKTKLPPMPEVIITTNAREDKHAYACA